MMAKTEEMEQTVCPKCGCYVTDGGYEQGGKTYCCRPCAMDQECECGCCEEVTQAETQGVSRPSSQQGS
jgi:hypothetical protein